ncbi:MAG: fumarylacetoacetate hydrolase family protein [Candidatus Thorarchaeota archaeon]|nr:fumarylacetoacetate hydrolase family protein [Candidatus Thorarchaeota archaeon]
MGVPSIGVELDSGILDIPDAASYFGRKYHVRGQSFPSTMLDLLSWESGIDVVRQIVERYNQTPSGERLLTLSLDSITLEAPIQRPGKIVALGRNYPEHAKETGSEVPKFPIIFAKFPSCVIGPNDTIHIPKVSTKIDWEVELAIVIGKVCKDVSEEKALQYIAGYTIINDVSARDLQRQDVQYVRAKSLDDFCPMGPCIVTTDEIGDGSGLKMSTAISGILKQNSTTSNMMFKVPHIISYLSKSFTLEPGDIIATGTPEGVGFARDPPEYLKSGDIVDQYIEKIGFLRNPVK